MLRRSFKYAFGAAVFLIAALFIGAMPLSSGASAKGEGERVRIYVLSNGFHSDIAIPRRNGDNLKALGVNEDGFPVAIDQVQYWAIGWGSLTAYTSLLAVSDLTIDIAAKALAFDQAVMHIAPLGALKPSSNVYAYDLSTDQFNRLLVNLESWFAGVEPLGVTQGFGDLFYSARGHFTPWYTCNSWTGRRLREIGLPIGAWTPIAQSLEYGLKRSSVR